MEQTNVDDGDLADVTDWGEAVLFGVWALLDDTLLTPQARTVLQAACTLLQGGGSRQDRLAYTMVLDALIASPDALQASLRVLRDSLVVGDEQVALMRYTGHGTRPRANVA